MPMAAKRLATRSRLRRALLLGVCPLTMTLAALPGEAQTAGSAATGSTTTTTTTSPHVVHHKRHRPAAKPATTAAVAATAAAAPVPASAVVSNRRPQAAPADTSESVIVTGSRVSRKARDSTTPVDVITAQALARTGEPNLVNALILTDASIETKTMGADTANLTSSIRLRGLNPNETLVLIDGKRRNGTSNITADGGPEGGATPVDINLIPAAAIDHIEVLRDGAAAQYGSDAIAGVVNVILKKNASGNVAFTTGANAYNGDGWTYQLDADKGYYFGNDGYVHASFQSYHADHFVTNTVDDRAAAGGFPPNSNKILSTPEETRQTASLAWGSTIVPDFAGGLQTYGFVSYGRRYGESYENYRTPTKLPEVYPDGFSPLETIFENQYGATLGLKAPDLLGFRVDLSTTWGQDNLQIGNKNTANTKLYNPVSDTSTLTAAQNAAITAANYASIAQYGFLGGYTPTNVLAQTMITSQWTNNLDLTRSFHLLHIPMTLAFGAEERMEDYKLGAGDPASWLLGGTQGFAGLLPSNAGEWHRDVWAGYVDDDTHPLKHWDLDLAGRYEFYTDTQHTFTGKVSTRYDFTDWIAARATVGNGFRAPTLAEEHFSALNVSPTGAQGILAANSPAAAGIGAIPLKPERSWNMGGGLVVEPVRDMTATLDLYQINIRDRVVLAGGVTDTMAAQAIEATGTQLPDFSATSSGDPDADVSAQYFANGVSTRTQGLDLDWNYLTRFGRWGRVTWSADLDLNRTRVTHIGNDSTPQHMPYANAQTVGWLTTATPRSKLILNAFWQIQKYDVNVRQIRWGQTKNDVTYQDQETNPVLQYSNQYFYEFKNTPRWTTDLEVGYQIFHDLHVAIGGNNLLNIRPRRMPAFTSYLGVQYYDIDSAQVPMTGGFYYGRVNLTF